jgi:hypothetical protein
MILINNLSFEIKLQSRILHQQTINPGKENIIDEIQVKIS